jgi:phosphatidylglycerol:prolipoprotein diacylglycerol transferase
MPGPFVHEFDPVLFSVPGVHLWWYGLSYTLGFLNAHFFLRRNRHRLGLSLNGVYDLTLLIAVGVLAGGRCLVVFNNEWSFYRENLKLIPAIWLGGLASHGVLAGGALGLLVFCRLRGKPLRPLADALAVAAALIMGCGRVGNFIDGQIVGSITDVPWAVKFPEADGFRHPVVLYDGLKNFLLVPVLLGVRRRGVPPGRVAAWFVFLYAVLRIPIDSFREYPITLLGLPTGQTFNLLMALTGLVLLALNRFRPSAPGLKGKAFPRSVWPVRPGPAPRRTSTGLTATGNRWSWRPWALAALAALALVIPSDATRDVPALYGDRHPGLEYSAWYPRLK